MRSVESRRALAIDGSRSSRVVKVGRSCKSISVDCRWDDILATSRPRGLWASMRHLDSRRKRCVSLRHRACRKVASRTFWPGVSLYFRPVQKATGRVACSSHLFPSVPVLAQTRSTRQASYVLRGCDGAGVMRHAHHLAQILRAQATCSPAQFIAGSSSLSHPGVCNSFEASDGAIHSRICRTACGLFRRSRRVEQFIAV